MEPAAEQTALFVRFGTALGLGLLVGLQREYAFVREQQEEEVFAGVRTFGLLALVGCSAAFAADVSNAPLVFVAVLVIAGVLIAAGYYLGGRDGGIGLTTEMAALLTLLAGALSYWGYLAFATALAVATTVLLAVKPEAQSFVRRLTREDVFATLKFAVIAVIVLPILPREPVGPPPFDVLVPYKVWLMVVFISGISFLGYVLIKVVGARRGIGLTGILGGMVSSTAVTLSFSQRSRDEEKLAPVFGLAILLAWTVMFGRVLVEVAALNAPLLRRLWPPLAAAAGVSLAYCAFLFFTRGGGRSDEPQEFRNPFRLGPAISFGLLYGVILLAARAAQLYLGSAGIYLSSIASGVADVDAITLSMAELSRGESGIDHETATRAIVLAALSNTLVKGGIVLSVGAPALRRALLPGLVLIPAVTLSVLFLL
jgi:uncharacterized membrane protein (DUF4010 family)